MKDYLKNNKHLFFLPLLVLPFVVLIFYVLGGGMGQSGISYGDIGASTAEGMNYSLPDADKSIPIMDKEEAYLAQSPGDLQNGNRLTNEPDSAVKLSGITPAFEAGTGELSHDDLLAYVKRQEQQALNELDQAPVHQFQKPKTTKSLPARKPSVHKKQEKKLSVADNPPPLNTTGIEELDVLFDQNEQLFIANDSLRHQVANMEQRLSDLQSYSNVFTVEIKEESAFEKKQTEEHLLKAEVMEETVVLTGNRVTLRLLTDVWVNGKRIPANTFVYGICSVENERLQMEVKNILCNEDILPVALTAYDMDGLPGLYVPDNVALHVYRDMTRSVNTSSMTGYTSNPLTYAGINAAGDAAQTLLKRTRLKKVHLRKNTIVLLFNNDRLIR